MSNYRLSEAAKEDLISIAQYGDENFGIVQSDNYRDQLKRRFLVIAERPMFFLLLIIFGLDTDAVFVVHTQFITELKVIVWKLFVLLGGKI